MGSQRRKPWARWLGVVLLAPQVLFWALLCWLLVFPSEGDVPTPRDEQDFRIDVAILCVAVVTLVAYGFSAGSRAWFRARDRY